MDKFFEHGEFISHVFVLSDIRRDPSEEDLQLIRFLNYRILPFSVILTKSDKISKMQKKERVQKVASALSLGTGNLLTVSAVTGDGKDALLKKIEEILALGA